MEIIQFRNIQALVLLKRKKEEEARTRDEEEAACRPKQGWWGGGMDGWCGRGLTPTAAQAKRQRKGKKDGGEFLRSPVTTRTAAGDGEGEGSTHFQWAVLSATVKYLTWAGRSIQQGVGSR